MCGQAEAHPVERPGHIAQLKTVAPRYIASGKDFMRDGAVDVRQAIVTANVIPRQLRVIKTQLMQGRRVQIMNMNPSVEIGRAHV